MRLLPAALALALAPSALALLHPRFDRPLSVWMADSVIARKQAYGLSTSGRPQVSYEHGTFQSALRALYEITKNETYLDWIQGGIDNVLLPDGNIGANYTMSTYVIDDIRLGPSMIKLYQRTGDKRYKVAADVLRTQLRQQPRNTEGGFFHFLRFPNQMWLDGLYMAEPFYALYAEEYEHGNATALFDLQLQFSLIWKHCRDKKTGLLRHGWYDNKAVNSPLVPAWADPVTGASPEVWIRAVGWYVVALVDLLTPPDAIPKWHPAQVTLRYQLNELVRALVKNADPATGAWWLVMTQVGREGNYIESSGSAMFVYAMLRAVSQGLVYDYDGSIVKTAKRAYEYLVDRFIIENPNGTLSYNGTVIVGHLDYGTFESYVSERINLNDVKGTAPFVLASMEYEKL
ncbi:family 88 glycosyl hydrolase [Auricularia subglabra TFB-10046 SS5]|nr:family 88 glycosyl hydrolase [Auricularia subglabra TFB-10046 SS5]